MVVLFDAFASELELVFGLEFESALVPGVAFAFGRADFVEPLPTPDLTGAVFDSLLLTL